MFYDLMSTKYNFSCKNSNFIVLLTAKFGLAPWIRRICFEVTSWIRIRIEASADPQHCNFLIFGIQYQVHWIWGVNNSIWLRYFLLRICVWRLPSWWRRAALGPEHPDPSTTTRLPGWVGDPLRSSVISLKTGTGMPQFGVCAHEYVSLPYWLVRYGTVWYGMVGYMT